MKSKDYPFSLSHLIVGELRNMISSVLMLLLAIYHQGSTDDIELTEQSSLCQCPPELPWPGHGFTYQNDQLLCGKELMYMVPNTTCDKVTIYSCKVNETVPDIDEKCGNSFCIPTSVKVCTRPNNKVNEHCLRHRFCHEERVMKKHMEYLYGKNWQKKFN